MPFDPTKLKAGDRVVTRFTGSPVKTIRYGPTHAGGAWVVEFEGMDGFYVADCIASLDPKSGQQSERSVLQYYLVQIDGKLYLQRASGPWAALLLAFPGEIVDATNHVGMNKLAERARVKNCGPAHPGPLTPEQLASFGGDGSWQSFVYPGSHIMATGPDKITPVQLDAAIRLIESGMESSDIGEALRLTGQQVAAVKAHVAMGTYKGTAHERRRKIDEHFAKLEL